MSKSVLMVLAHNNFRDEEYTSARKALENAGARITTASTIKNGAAGIMGLRLAPDLLIDEVNPDDFDAVVFVGGTGSSQYWHDVKAHEIAVSLNKKDNVVAATSHAPVTLAVAGLLKDKRATGHVTVFEKLKVQGAEYTGKKVEVDGNIITSSGANAAKEFARAIAQAIK